MTYVPKPIDVKDVDLDAVIEPLIERLAEHNHDLWASQRFKDGWRLGKKRNDARKEHPCLVPYAELPESEKEYDRITVIGALKAIVALGYQLKKKRNPAKKAARRKRNG